MDDSSKNMKPDNHFWEPWGAGGCVGRTVLFLLGIIIFAFVFSLLGKNKDNDIFDPTAKNDPDPYQEARDSSFVKEWRDSIPNVDELPDPEDNFIPPVDSTKIIPNPEDSLARIINDQIIVVFDSKDVKADMTSFAKQFKAEYPDSAYLVTYYNPAAGTMLLTVPDDKLITVFGELPDKIKGIEFKATLNEILSELGKPTDPGFAEASYDEYYKLIQAYDAWEITRGSKDVKVAIVDTYFDITHPELDGRHVDAIHIPSKTRDVLPPATPPANDDELGSYCHGSHVAGLAVGAQGNNIGCSGIAPECSWIPIALGKELTNFNIIEGILYAVYHEADVINMSLGRKFEKHLDKKLSLQEQAQIAKTTSKRGEEVWEYVLKVANDHKTILCISAGNSNIIMGLDPMKRSKNAIKVEAVKNNGMKCKFSNYGTLPEYQIDFSTVSAPGLSLWSVTDKRYVPLLKADGTKSSSDGFQEMSGTSMASPVVAGAVALLKSKNKDLTCEDVIKILTLTGKQVDKKNHIGPLIQIRDALDHTTTGSVLKFNDLINNHDLLIGKWKSTHELIRQNEKTRQKLGNMWEYLTFTNTSEGLLEFESVEDGKVWKAQINVSWGKNSVTFVQVDHAIASDGNKIHKDDLVCKPGKNNILEVSVRRNGVERYTFQLEKVE